MEYIIFVVGVLVMLTVCRGPVFAPFRKTDEK